MVAVVQLVEHLVVVQDVAGSSPVSHPTKRLIFGLAAFLQPSSPNLTFFSPTGHELGKLASEGISKLKFVLSNYRTWVH